MKQTRGIAPSALRLTDLDAPMILTFLTYLEQQRGNQVRSRNIRLSALRTFFRFVALREPESVDRATRVLAIPCKREDKKLIGYLTREEMDALLAAPDRSRWMGRRDYALLLTMYNSGARVSAIVTLTRQQVHVGQSTFLQLHGKGRKERTIPLWPDTARVLKTWFHELGAMGAPMAFPNARGNPLSRYGAKYLLQRAVQRAAATCPSLSTKTITPHVVRHYLPFLTMSGNLMTSTDMAGFYRSQGFDRLTITQHSFLVLTDRCSGWSLGENHPSLQQNHVIVDSAL